MTSYKAARALGWASLAVGLTEIAATRWFEEEMGVDDHHTLLRSFGLREIATGAMILAQKHVNPALASGMWGRVAGDALDLTLLGAAVPTSRNRTGLAAITSMVLGITGLDIWVASLVQRDLNRSTQIDRSRSGGYSGQRSQQRLPLPRQTAGTT